MSNKVFSILHISDLHKDESCNYNQLLDSLKADKDKFPSLGIAPVKYILVEILFMAPTRMMPKRHVRKSLSSMQK